MSLYNLKFNNGGSAIKISNSYPSFTKFTIIFDIVSYDIQPIKSLFANKPDTGYTTGYQCYITNNNITIQTRYGSTSSDVISTPDTNINDGKKHKVKVILTNSNAEIYLDNNLLLNKLINIPLNTGLFEIGGLTYNGSSDNRGLSNAIINNIYIYDNDVLQSLYYVNDNNNIIKDYGPLSLNGSLTGSTYEWITTIVYYLIQDNNNLCNTDGIGLTLQDILPYTIDKFNTYGMDDLININKTVISKINNNKYNIAMLK